ncbi:GTP cyclohydrolase N terminal-domain-containing protein [Mycena alexandri]|uniref:GTP cyclohydrolase N terminal-domain-containing protein n=1 Tax=Mycena alexandri TaxID=1745969 RepID=A0AAD6SMT9_9AGAR|nr:GTP cyclohydrolase N terminal-domain-containing protein [Mycena alexandri]
MSSDALLRKILTQLDAMQIQQQTMQAQLDALSSPPRPAPSSAGPASRPISIPSARSVSSEMGTSPPLAGTPSSTSQPPLSGTPSSMPHHTLSGVTPTEKERERILYPGRVNLTTYPGQHSITPYPLQWGASSPTARGPIICSRLPASIKARNALGAHSGSYSIYRALSIALGSLSPTHKPDFTMTEPPVDIPPNPAWGAIGGWSINGTPASGGYGPIVSMDPYGHLVPTVFRREIEEQGLDVRPSIAVTRAHIKMSELDDAVRRGALKVDGKIVLNSRPLPGLENPGVEVTVSKAAVEPVWHLPGVAERFGISELLLRRALFEETGGSFPELITRPDIKVFMPPIGGLTVYIFGNPAFMSDQSKELTLRVHDECNGSDVFGSDICTCKPYLTYAIEECIRGAQRGGVGVVVYFRKEGRALGEVTKYLVYNLRKRGGDSADKYFKSTELIAGVKDMRFQALMPDVLHWLGIRKVDHMVSMSDMKYDAIVKSGIPILNRYDIPEHLIPPDSRVEIDAKIAAGYFSSGKQVTEADLVKTVGRTWEETDH